MHHFSTKTNVKHLLNLCIPLILTGLVQSSLGFIETIFLAQLGEQVMAAGSLVNWLFATLIVILFGTFSAINVLIAHKRGAQATQQITFIIRDGLLLALILLIPTFLLFWNIAPILLLFGQSTQVATLTKIYLHAMAWGLLPKFVLIILLELMLGLGHSRSIMIFTLITTPVYIFFSYVLIFGKLGLPAFGIAGAGWGMTLADWIIASILLIYLCHIPAYTIYLRNIFTVKKPFYLWEIVHLGFPIGVMYCIEVGFFFAISVIMGAASVSALAANQIVMQYLGPLMNIIFSIAQAITVRMGYLLGAGQFCDARKTAQAGISLSGGFMLCIALVYWFFPGKLIAVDFNLKDPEYADIIRFASSFLLAASFFQILESIRIALFGALRALKDTHFTLWTSILCFWIIPFPTGYLLALYTPIGWVGFWWGITIGSCCNILLLYPRMHTRLQIRH